MSEETARAGCGRFAPMLTAREGELDAAERAALDAHLATCDRCRAEQADLAATDGLVSEALLAAAARRDFAPFVDGVMARIAAAPARARPSWLDGVLAWIRGHRVAATTGGLVPALAALALIVYFSTDRTVAPQAGEVEVVAEGRVPMVLRTADGPVVLLGDADESGT